MNNTHKSFKSGDLVEVRQPDEILRTIDTNGQLDARDDTILWQKI